jgi:hypothetical protein
MHREASIYIVFRPVPLSDKEKPQKLIFVANTGISAAPDEFSSATVRAQKVPVHRLPNETHTLIVRHE